MLLIPRRIEQIKEEGRAEMRQEAYRQGFLAGRASLKPQPDNEDIERLIAWYNSGGITIEELETIFAQLYKGKREAD